MTPTFRHLRVDRDAGHATTIWLDVAERKVNVFAEAFVDELHVLVDWLIESRDPATIVFRSAKPSGFLAGADLRELAAFRSAADVDRFLNRGQGLLDRLSQLLQPTVAVIHGACLGGGLELALACQYRIARSDSATQLGLPETKLELTPAWGGTRRLPRLIGLEAGLRMMLTGQAMDVASAGRLGLIDAAARCEQFDDDVREFVRRVSMKDDVPRKLLAERSSSLALLAVSTRRQRLRVMAAVRRECCDGTRGTPSQRAILAAVDAGYGDAGRDEQSTIRDDFVCLVLSEACRERLAKFCRSRA